MSLLILTARLDEISFGPDRGRECTRGATLEHVGGVDPPVEDTERLG